MRRVLIGLSLFLGIGFASAQEVGSVDTAFKLLGPNHKVVVEAFDDPEVKGVTCYVSSSKAGGLTGALGVASERSEASIACRQVGPIDVSAKVKATPKGAEVFNESRSILFKKMRVVRMFDAQRNVLLYLVYFDKLIDGSPKKQLNRSARTALAIKIAKSK